MGKISKHDGERTWGRHPGLSSVSSIESSASDCSILLESGNLEVELQPLRGGRISRFSAMGAGGATELLVPCDRQTGGPEGRHAWGAFPLMPYSNRIHNGSFAFAGRRFALPAHAESTPHAMHGVCRHLAWQVKELSRSKATITVEYEGEHWPWPIRAKQEFSLAGDTLTVCMHLTNLGCTPMPAGLGFHPFLRMDDSAEALFSAGVRWACDENRLPRAFQYRRETVSLRRAIWRESAYYGHFSDWDGEAKIHYAAGCLVLQASDTLRNLVCYAQKGGAYLCIEPMSHVTNAHNLFGRFDLDLGLRIIEPDESMHGLINLIWMKAG
jgi:aldose 1-epimerase